MQEIGYLWGDFKCRNTEVSGRDYLGICPVEPWGFGCSNNRGSVPSVHGFRSQGKPHLSPDFACSRILLRSLFLDNDRRVSGRNWYRRPRQLNSVPTVRRQTHVPFCLNGRSPSPTLGPLCGLPVDRVGRIAALRGSVLHSSASFLRSYARDNFRYLKRTLVGYSASAY